MTGDTGVGKAQMAQSPTHWEADRTKEMNKATGLRSSSGKTEIIFLHCLTGRGGERRGALGWEKAWGSASVNVKAPPCLAPQVTVLQEPGSRKVEGKAPVREQDHFQFSGTWAAADSVQRGWRCNSGRAGLQAQGVERGAEV